MPCVLVAVQWSMAWGAWDIGGIMSSTVQNRTFSSNARAIELDGRAAEGKRRAQGWLIVVGASAILWTGIIVAIVGIAGLAH